MGVSPLGCSSAISIVERAYQLDGDTQAWLRQIAEAAAPEMNRDVGVIAYTADPDTMIAREASGAGITDTLANALRQLNDHAPADVRAELASAPRGFYTVQEEWRSYPNLLALWNDDLVPLGIADAVGVCAPAGNETVMIWAPSPTVEKVAPRVKAMWSQVGVHLAAAHRLRASLASQDVERLAEAIFDVDGRIQHAVGGAEPRGARNALQTAVRAIEKARGPMRRDDPGQALALWSGLVQGRWSLVDYWDHDGRRFFAAHPNAPGVIDPRRLRAREASALALTIDGASLKEIAYSLGISAGNARALVSKALRKLGLESRAALYRFALEKGGVIELTLEGGSQLHVLAAPTRQSRLPVKELLTDAELDVATLAAAGCSNAEIARQRGSAEPTVANQMASVLRKLGLRSRVDLGVHVPTAVAGRS